MNRHAPNQGGLPHEGERSVAQSRGGALCLRRGMAPALVALASLLVSGHFARPRNASTVKALRQHLLNDFDSYVPPSTDGVHGVQIGIQYKIFKVLKVDVSSGELQLKVWRRSRWRDERLAWDPDAWEGITQIILHPGVEEGGTDQAVLSNMWVPQVVLYNGVTPQEQTMETGAAWVTHDGSVWHSAPGVIDVTCRFAGLQRFPRDELSCPIEIASWSYSDLVTNLTFMDDRPCVDMAYSNPTAGSTYQEFKLTNFSCHRNTLTYPCCGDATFSQLIIRVYMKRSSTFYSLTIEIPGIIFTLLCMTSLWLDSSNVGERLGFCATMLLVTQVLMIVVSEQLPTCGEILWIELLNLANFTFCVITLFESCISVHISFRGIGTVNEANAETFDARARLWIPSLYILAIGTVYSLDLDDGYEADGLKKMFQGVGNPALRATVVIAPLTLLAVAGAWWWSRKHRTREKRIQVAEVAHAPDCAAPPVRPAAPEATPE